MCICELKVKTRFSAQLPLTERTNSESRSEFWEKKEQMKDCFHLGYSLHLPFSALCQGQVSHYPPHTLTHTYTQNYWIRYKGVWCIREGHKRQVSDKTSQHLKCKVTWPVSFWSGRGSHRAIETTLVQIATIQGLYLKNGALVNVTFHCNSSRTHINSSPTKQLGRLKGTYQGSI